MNKCYCKRFILNSQFVDCKNFNLDIVSKGESVYDVIRIIDSTPLFFNEHIERLHYSAKLSNLKLWLDKNEIKDEIIKLLKENKIKNGNVEVIFNFNGNKTNFIVYLIRHKYPSKKNYIKGVPTIIHFAERENPNAKIKNKTLRYTTNKLLKENKVYEAILVDKNGYITEGSRSNIFFIKDNNVYTPPVESVLPGITREHIINICKTLNFKVIENKISFKDINIFDAVFLTGTSPKVLPISKIDNTSFNIKNFVLGKIVNHFNYEIVEYIRKF
ncbi:MAG: aminotransferase class IV family protein [Bacteroidetes bacterium]|nr:aminotransferase class IV family protein [Bacteroidota bacterium]